MWALIYYHCPIVIFFVPLYLFDVEFFYIVAVAVAADVGFVVSECCYGFLFCGKYFHYFIISVRIFGNSAAFFYAFQLFFRYCAIPFVNKNFVILIPPNFLHFNMVLIKNLFIEFFLQAHLRNSANKPLSFHLFRRPFQVNCQADHKCCRKTETY